jgi:hypothetical protein
MGDASIQVIRPHLVAHYSFVSGLAAEAAVTTGRFEFPGSDALPFRPRKALASVHTPQGLRY